MERSKTKWRLLLAMGVSALVAGVVAPQGSYGLLGLGALFWVCGWNVYAYFSNKYMFGMGAADMNAGEEPSRRTATFWMSLVFYFVCLPLYVWQYYR
jgi:hypothetical protein